MKVRILRDAAFQSAHTIIRAFLGSSDGYQHSYQRGSAFDCYNRKTFREVQGTGAKMKAN